ncbi:cleavage and polyadenylation specificity factor subunit 1 [Cimex lectularius]|uniref:Cleavage and polyadenylation specificity factor subunit 1 n=1 Tax=Cimex lectularius TaxID=79782 RepID=A0A8I6SKB3_CIMLE|nr:cleavage and polyadenylation specificity factor subunit 1 [Cimex lectularius]XP_014260040.1 cleavage and polyadenylation specificity factor subunit 1 [Cimex lectularius]XP_014260041.1 cleavage and polyadenylation specificity factor subunit 1 [Cimex lectularius]
MFSICKLTHPATGIEHAITCYFFNRIEKSLVVAGANVIRVFRFMPEIDIHKRHTYTEKNPPKMRLECVASYTLFGNVMSMQCVSFIGSQRDSLLLSFKDAKLSVVEYDLDTNSLHTVSLHYFEEEEMQGGWTQHYSIPIVRVDPEGRCAVMLIYGRKLVVLPFRRENPIEDPSVTNLDPTPTPVQNRPPVLTSYTIVLKEIEEKMENILDVQFLHGYNEPTLLILFEPMQTFPGRIAVRRDTCCMVAISLNMDQKVHPVIWSVNNLPMDCFSLVPVAKPLAGTLVLSHNALIYLNQSVPPYGVSLNSITEVSTGFPLKVQDGVKISLEGAQVCFLSHDRLVMSLKGGELYVLTLHADSMRSVRSFHFQKAAASVLTTSMCLCEDKFLFLGSRLGNSLLLRLTEKEYSSDVKPVIPVIDLCQPPPVKKKRLDTLGDCMATDVTEIRDEDELEVYGNEVQTSVQICSYSFEVCDSLLNIGPCGNVSMGEPAFLSEEFTNSPNPDIELVTSSGYGKNGALCVLQRSIRPQVATTFELPGCINMWTVIGSKHEVLGENQELTHAFMILTQRDATMILQTGREINELDHSGFNTHGPTIFAGNVGNNKYIVQVSTMGVRLLHGSEQIQHLPIDLGSPLVTASASDPYILCLSGDGQLILLTLKEQRNTGRLVISKPKIQLRPQITNICVYRDISGMFTMTAEELESEVYTLPSSFVIDNVKTESIDDEEELLYGESSALNIKKEQNPLPYTNNIPPSRKPAWWRRHLQEMKVSYWTLLTRDNGHLEIYSLPDLKLSYLVANVSLAHGILADSLAAPPTLAQTNSDNAHAFTEPAIKEILLVGLGHNGSKPLLFIRLENEVLIYQAYSYAHVSLNLKFSKIGTLLVKDVLRADKDDDPDDVRVNQLRFFSNISGYCGVFVCGNNPYWVFLTARGELRTHPMYIDGPVMCFAAFHNINCPQGFLYFNNKAELRICVLPTHLSYDAAWPVRKVPLRCTVHFVTYHLESKTYCIVTSVAEPTKEYYKFNGEDKELAVEDKDDRFPFPLAEKFSISLFSPVSWEIIPNTRMELDDWEHVTCLKNVSLAYEGTRSGLKGYISVGTNYNYSEDITSRGRIWLFDIIDVVPEPGQPLTKNRIKMVYNKDQKGPITAITHVLGFLVSAVGQKIYIWQLKDNDLVGVAFIDTQVYIHQILSIKSLILVADIYKSITLLRFQEEYRTLSLVSRDFRATEAYAIDFLIDNTHLGFLVTDREKNIVLYMYQPEARESFGGQKLIRKGDFHVGQHINTFFRIKCRTSEIEQEKKHLAGVDKRHVTVFATLDGAMGYLLPLPEKTYRRLLMLQNLLITYVPHIAGLNPKAYRQYKSSNKLLGNVARGIIDGELVWIYISLSIPERHEIAKKIGTKVDELLEDMLDLEMLTASF